LTRFLEPQKLLHLSQLFSLTDFRAFRLTESKSEARAENAVWNQRGRFLVNSPGLRRASLGIGRPDGCGGALLQPAHRLQFTVESLPFGVTDQLGLCHIGQRVVKVLPERGE